MVMTPATAIMKLQFAADHFFAIDPKKLSIETPAHTGRTYILFKGRIVAVSSYCQPQPTGDSDVE